MAATCPKCGGKLKLTDWKPNCPHCGVNMVYYGMEERLLLDADQAEAEHARTQVKFDRLRASFIGSKLAIVRIVFSVLPIVGLFLPLAKFGFTAPYAQYNGSVNVISLYNLLSSRMDFDSLIAMCGSKLMGTAFILFAVSIVCILLSAVGVLAHLICLTMACSPKGKQRNYTLNVLNLLFTVASVVTFFLFCGKITALFPNVIQLSSVGFGAYVYIALLVLCFVADILCFVKGIEVKYKPCFIGNIPAEEYFQLVEDGVPLDQIRAVMAERTAVKEAAEAAKKAEEEAKKAAEEAAKEPAEAK
ncbi:MAG: hypothetical protein ACI4I5_09740 [Acutalibacteraceae bacterium]